MPSLFVCPALTQPWPYIRFFRIGRGSPVVGHLANLRGSQNWHILHLLGRLWGRTCLGTSIPAVLKLSGARIATRSIG